MDIILASQMVIVASIAILAYNLYQTSLSISTVENQVDDFLELLNKNPEEAQGFSALSFIVYFILPLLYVVLLFFANFSVLVLGVVAVKLFAGGWLSHKIQNEILSLKAFPQKYYFLSKVDHTINVIAMAVILYFVFV
ncbi:MAG: hypothetical protein OCD01_18075 [Fibrobacterales bacterium]